MASSSTRAGVVKLGQLAQRVGGQLKGTTPRDIYDKVNIAFENQGAQAQQHRGQRRVPLPLIEESGASSATTPTWHGAPGNQPDHFITWNYGGASGMAHRTTPELVDSDEDNGDAAAAPPAAEKRKPRRIVATHRLPLRAERNPKAPTGFDFSVDADALPLQLSRGLPDPVVFIGALPSAAGSIPNPDELAADLMERFSCIPVFLDPALHQDFGGFSEGYLRPRLLPPTPSSAGGVLSYSEGLYRAYISVNTQYADRVFQNMDPEEDLVFIHDYHLWALPTLLRRRAPLARISFFLHSPFPALEVFRAFPVREDLLRALLNADVVGFHSHDDARRFLHSCSRIMGVSHYSRRGQFGIDYLGRTVVVKVRSLHVDMFQIREVLSSPETLAKISEISAKYADRQILLSVGDGADVLEGIVINLLAMEKLLEAQPKLRGQVVLVQINPAGSPGGEVLNSKLRQMQDQINGRFGMQDYEPVVIMDGPLPMHEMLSFYALADICIVTSTHSNLNKSPHIYTVCRQKVPNSSVRRESVIVASEFVGCLPALSCAISVSQWILNDVTEALSSAVGMPMVDRQLGHSKHFNQLKVYDTAYWSWSLDQELQRACNNGSSTNFLSFGLDMDFHMVVLGPGCQKLLPAHIHPSYIQSVKRLLLLDYDGTMVPHDLIFRAPRQYVISVLNELSSDPKNIVFVFSGQMKDTLHKWFAACEKLGIFAQHGSFTRVDRYHPWGSPNFMLNCSPRLTVPFDSKGIIIPIMKHYADVTNGSYIEFKDKAVVWHYEEVDTDVGELRARELQNELANLNLLTNEPVTVKAGRKTVEVIPQGVGKGIAVQNLISSMGANGNMPDFILCIGDDDNDRDMFEAIASSTNSSCPEATEVFACTVGKKPSLAKYYLDDSDDVLKILQGLSELE